MPSAMLHWTDASGSPHTRTGTVEELQAHAQILTETGFLWDLEVLD